jgi:hypothetical protein
MSGNDEDLELESGRESFGTWLLTQVGREGWIGDLAAAAKADRGFPRDGDPDAVRARLNAMQAESDMFEAVDSAESDWRDST